MPMTYQYKKNKYNIANTFFNTIFLSTVLFSISVLINHLYFIKKAVPAFFWQIIPAFISGISLDFAIYFSTLSFILSLNKKLLTIKKILLCVLSFSVFLPLFDILYFSATLERFNWIVLNFINLHSIKGYLGNSSYITLLAVLASILFTFCILAKGLKYIHTNAYNLKLITALAIFSFFSFFFFRNIYIPTKNNFTGHVETVMAKNRIIKNLSSGALSGFFQNKNAVIKNNNFEKYTQQEERLLNRLGLQPQKDNITNKARYKRIVLIVLESFALEYLHKYNSAIPSEASAYLDYLIHKYPHCDNFYASNFPSLEGFNAILGGRAVFNKSDIQRQKYNLASIFESISPNSTLFLRGTSRYYGSENITIEKIFGFSKLVGYENLTVKYPEPASYRWGYNDKYLYEEAINYMKDNKEKMFFIAIKLLNQHQPISSAISDSEILPESIKSLNNSIISSIYDANYYIQHFIEKLEQEKLLDDETLVIITSDHYPPLGYGHTNLVNSNEHLQLGKLPLIFISTNLTPLANISSKKKYCQIDIAPTICDLIGYPKSKEHQGNSMLQADFPSRSIGILNQNSVFVQTDDITFEESLSSPATNTKAILKWINNLNSFQD